ncbi:multiheme c-type cytochrome [Mariniblastus fucicola]|uniref:Tetratricopeptide repeat protein n=1 Tax=Mariniblastus fucicola TaxID=980251 RepID=A0A5B9PFA5_9BACT|nr:multiheme c-type cytochrome [Mariniblastus fucicola]QEG23316.1 Tetratricopeptide repeat protein [Mariniblastus fucicola]
MPKRAHLIFLVLFVLIIVSGYLLADYYRGAPPEAMAHASYVGRETCVSCHQQQVDLFVGSHHDQAMDFATEESVLGDFDDRTIEHFGTTSRLFRDGDRFMINTEGPDGEMQDFEIKYTFGVEPLQQYMVELDRGRVQVLRVSWDTAAEKWFYLSPPDVKDKLNPTDPLHWTGVTQNWNVSCAECHSTNLKKNFDIASASWNTTWSEIDVSCEACHGPASLHNELASSMSPFWDRTHGMGLAKLKTDRNLDQIETCAPCHSRRTIVGTDYKPGCNYDDYHSLQLLNEPLYHADGQIRDEDYVHGSFLQSKMFHNGIKCSDCHDPHSLKLKHSGNNVCTSCHQHPSGKYDSESHHHHQPGTEGAMCVNCHMPTTTYMDVDARRDHSFRVPRPDLSVSLGTPNACTQCHLGLEPKESLPKREQFAQYLDWLSASETGDDDVEALLARIDKEMEAACAKWYPPESSPPKTSWYPELAQAQFNIRNQEPATELLGKLAKDVANPAIIRATAADLLSRHADPQAYETAIGLLDDRDVKVVVAAIGTLEIAMLEIQNRQMYSTTPGSVGSELQQFSSAIGNLLQHESPRVRFESARALASLAPTARNSALTAEQKRSFETSLEAYRQSLMVMSDTAGAHMQLGGLQERMGQLNQAADSYRTAIRLQPELTGPRSSLAYILENKVQSLQSQLQQSNSEAARNQIENLMAQITDLRKRDHELLGIDVERAAGLPGVHTLHYRYGMSSYLQKDLATAEKHLKIAAEMAPEQEGYLMGLATFYLQQKKLVEADRLIAKLLNMDPDHPGYLALKQQLDSLQ